MSNEKMVELKIKIPARWLNFMDEYYQITGRDRNEDLISMVRCQIEMPMLEDEDLPTKDRVRLVEKHKLTDMHAITQWERDEAAGIPHRIEPAPQIKTGIETTVRNEQLAEVLTDFVARGIWKFVKNATPQDIEKIRALSPEDLDERLKHPIAATGV